MLESAPDERPAKGGNLIRTSDMADAFAQELTILSRKYGIAISEPSKLFVLEGEDYGFSYFCDTESCLRLA